MISDRNRSQAETLSAANRQHSEKLQLAQMKLSVLDYDPNTAPPNCFDDNLPN